MNPSDDHLIRMYSNLRASADRIARDLESRGYKGEYQRIDNTFHPLDPQTRPTKFRWRPQ